jgi:molybdopterin-guanine dinucleotide biosynthesis protein A
MGRDKAFLPSGSGPLVKQIADDVAAAAGSVALIGRPDEFRGLFDYDCLPDLQPSFGPLSGIHSALKSHRGDYNLMLACDMPETDREFLVSLLRCAVASGRRCVAAVDATGQWHPLCAVYRRSALDAVERAMQSSHPCLMDLLHELDALPFECPSTILNCNTPADWAAFQAGRAAALSRN